MVGAKIISGFHSKKNEANAGNEKLRIIEAAALLLKCDIYDINQTEQRSIANIFGNGKR